MYKLEYPTNKERAERVAKRGQQKDIQVIIERSGHVPLNEVAANVKLAKSLLVMFLTMFYDH